MDDGSAWRLDRKLSQLVEFTSRERRLPASESRFQDKEKHKVRRTVASDSDGWGDGGEPRP
jgi:hypothetical protein